MISRVDCFKKYAGRNLKTQINTLVALMGVLIFADIFALIILNSRMVDTRMVIMEAVILGISAVGLYLTKNRVFVILFLIEQFVVMGASESKTGVVIILLLIAIIRELSKFECEIKYYQTMDVQELPEPIGIQEKLNATSILTIVIAALNFVIVIRGIFLMIAG